MTAAQDPKDILTCETVEPHVARVTLNRPAKRNAFNVAMTARLDAAIREVDEDDDIRVAILVSTHPTVFCAGADLQEMSEGKLGEAAAKGPSMMDLFLTPRRKPWIAAVEGTAVAGGFELVLSCDMVVASSTARFGLPEAKLGLYPYAGGMQRLPRAMPRNIAIEALLTGEPFSAQTAFQHGLANRLTEPGRAFEEALTLARAIAANAPLSVEEILQVARVAGHTDGALVEQMCCEGAERVLSSADSREGPLSFMEKRAPVWSRE